jgi:KipI family sensor histidine kinase inhibitor
MMRFLPVNLDAMMVELEDLAQTLALLASLKDDPIPGIMEMVPAARTLLIRFRPAALPLAALIEAIVGRSVSARIERAGRRIEIPVHYDGEDLADVAALLRTTPEEIVRRHTRADYTVAFTGFAPGFAYLAGGHPSFDLPRRRTPRTRIPAGAVGLAGTFSAVYPQATPGGWQIIGTTPMAMWDISRAVPALLQPGIHVQFVDIATLSPEARAALPTAAPPAARRARSQRLPARGAALEVRATGLQTVFQDLGRHGQAGQGLSSSGAMDQAACKAANRLVGNPSDSACLETVNGGLTLCSKGETVVAITGADAQISVTASTGECGSAARYAAMALADGDVLKLGEPTAGTRCYVAVRGGFEVVPVLGSCATDTLARVGPDPVAVGDRLAVRPVVHGAVVALPQAAPSDLPTTQTDITLDVVLGPRTDWFTPEALAHLCTQRWRVTPQLNRVGIRLEGEIGLARAIDRELPSEGTVLGAIQVPASGQPVLFMADHPVTGGYPVIAVVAPYHLDRAGQIPVNAWVRFNPIRPFQTYTPPRP